jgi:predicted transposase YbfD/YdcC
MLAIAGAVITIDGVGRQRDIAQKVLDKKADYMPAVSGSLRSPFPWGSKYPTVRLSVRR